MARPRATDEQRSTWKKTRSIRLSDEEWEKFRGLGGSEWLGLYLKRKRVEYKPPTVSKATPAISIESVISALDEISGAKHSLVQRYPEVFTIIRNEDQHIVGEGSRADLLKNAEFMKRQVMKNKKTSYPS